MGIEGKAAFSDYLSLKSFFSSLVLGADKTTWDAQGDTCPRSGKCCSGNSTSSNTGAADVGTGSRKGSRRSIGPIAKL